MYVCMYYENMVFKAGMQVYIDEYSVFVWFSMHILSTVIRKFYIIIY